MAGWKTQNACGWPLFNMHSMAGLMNGLRVEFHLDMQNVGEQIFVNPWFCALFIALGKSARYLVIAAVAA